MAKPRKSSRSRDNDEPTHKLKLKARNRNDPATNVVGVAWEHDGGRRISIALHPGVVISWRDCEDFMLTLWRD